LDMKGEDIVIAYNIEHKLNSGPILQDPNSERIKYVCVKERYYIVAKQFRTGMFVVMGMKDPKSMGWGKTGEGTIIYLKGID